MRIPSPIVAAGLVASALVFTACAKKSAEPTGAPAGAGITAEIPKTPEAKAFARQLVDLEVSGLNPTGTSQFEVLRMTFDPSGTWEADARLELGVEKVDCDETGSWKIDTMEGDAAVMVWTITKSTCPSRSAGDETRLQMEILDDGTWKVAFR